jgi:hypothetical protein
MNKSQMMSKIKYCLPIYPYLYTWGEWETAMSEDPDPLFSFLLAPIHQQANRGIDIDPRKVRDVFELRHDFFAIQTPTQALAFFRTFGPLQIKQQLGNEAAPVRFSAVMQRRSFWEDALLNRSVEKLNREYRGDHVAEGLENMYLWQPLPMELLFGQPLCGRVVCKDVEDSLRTSVFLSRLEGFRWRRCAREDCGNLFKLTSKRRRLYCGSDCAHLQSQRSYTERKQTGESTPSKHKPEAKVGKRRKGL